MSRLELGTSPTPDKVLDKLLDLFPDESFAMEPDVEYRRKQQLKSDYEYRVSESNEISFYERGDLLKCKEVDLQEYIPIGVTYLFVTRLNQLHIVRYLVDKQIDHMKISDTKDGGRSEVVPVSDIDKIFIVKEIHKRVND